MLSANVDSAFWPVIISVMLQKLNVFHIVKKEHPFARNGRAMFIFIY